MNPGDFMGVAPDTPRLRTFKLGINYFGIMLTGGALKPSKREDSGSSGMGQVRCQFLEKAKIQEQR